MKRAPARQRKGRGGWGLQRQARKRQAGEKVASLQGQSRRDCTGLFGVQSRCRRKESDTSENVLCRGLSRCISSSLARALRGPTEAGPREAAPLQALGGGGDHFLHLPHRISVARMERRTAPLITRLILSTAHHPLMPKWSVR